MPGRRRPRSCARPACSSTPACGNSPSASRRARPGGRHGRRTQHRRGGLPAAARGGQRPAQCRARRDQRVRPVPAGLGTGGSRLAGGRLAAPAARSSRPCRPTRARCAPATCRASPAAPTAASCAHCWRPQRDARVLFVGTGDLARSMLPLFRAFDVGVWNHRPTAAGAPDRTSAAGLRTDEADAAAAWATDIVFTTPRDPAHDSAWRDRLRCARAARASCTWAGGAADWPWPGPQSRRASIWMTCSLSPARGSSTAAGNWRRRAGLRGAGRGAAGRRPPAPSPAGPLARA